MFTLYRDNFGPQNAQSIVWLHGFLGNGADWIPFSSQIEGFHHVIVDLPGHGKSLLPPTRGEAGFEETVSALAELIQTECSKPPVVVAYSMGGRLALALASKHPSAFAGLVIVSASPGLADSHERENRQRWDHDLGKKLRETPRMEFLDAWYDQELFKTLSKQPDLLETLKNSRLNIDLQSVSESLAYTGAGVMPYIGDRIHDLEVPLMYVTGSEDRKYAKIGRELTTGKGNIQLEIFSEASHAAHIEKPLEFIKVLRTFLKTIQGGL